MRGRKRRNIYNYIVTLILLVAVVGGAFLVFKRTPVSEGEESVGQVLETEELKKKESKEKGEKKEEKVSEEKIDTGKEKVAQFDGADPNEREELTGVITYAEVDEKTLMVRVNIDQYLAEGTCKMELSKDGEVFYTETVGVTDSAATATCKGFNVATAGFPGGKVNIKILVTVGEKTGTIKGEVNL